VYSLKTANCIALYFPAYFGIYVLWSQPKSAPKDEKTVSLREIFKSSLYASIGLIVGYCKV
jgi:hypothetical protein